MMGNLLFFFCLRMLEKGIVLLACYGACRPVTGKYLDFLGELQQALAAFNDT